MSKFFTLIKENHKSRQARKSFWQKIFCQKCWLTSLSILMVVILAVSYIYLTNTSAASSYEIKDLETRIEQLKEQNKSLELKSIEMQSIQKVESAVGELNLVASGPTQYLSAKGISLAAK